MSENMKNGLLWAAAALGVLWLIQGLLKGLTGLFIGGFGGRDMDMDHGKGFGGHRGMGEGMPHGGGYESLVSLAFIIVIAIIAIIVWAIVSKKKKKQSEQLVDVQSAKEEDNDLAEKSEDIVQVNDEENNTSEVKDLNNEVK